LNSNVRTSDYIEMRVSLSTRHQPAMSNDNVEGGSVYMSIMQILVVSEKKEVRNPL
jgi:hypothetical protein